ncbi:MAG: 8-oxo-dGTP diphosphatase [Nanoarchaeota archaeon]
MTRIETVTIVHQHPRILLGMKKKKFGKGRYNGFDGKVETNETEKEAAIRETFEEAGIKIINPEKKGIILFEFQTDEQDHLVHFFKANKYSGNPVESNEMIPKWFNINKIPYDQMWADDRYWLPLLIEGKKFQGNFVFDKNHKIVKYTLEENAYLK